MHKLGAPIRPKSYRDEDVSPKRIQVFVCGVVSLLLILGAVMWCAASAPRTPVVLPRVVLQMLAGSGLRSPSAWCVSVRYHSENQSYKQRRVRDPSMDDVKDLFEREDDGDIESLECKCSSKSIENHPSLLDLESEDCAEEIDDGLDGQFRTRIYERCIENFDLGAQAEGLDTVSPRTCADSDSNNFFENMCVTFVGDLQTEWAMKKQKVFKLHSSVSYAEEILEDYYDVCTATLYKQASFVEMLHASLEHFGVDGEDKVRFDDDIRWPFHNTLVEIDDNICIYPDEESALYNELLSNEQATVEAAFQAHFDECAPPSCSYEELESTVDLLLKTMSLLSPLMTFIMGAGAFAYAMMEKDNWVDDTPEATPQTTENPNAK